MLLDTILLSPEIPSPTNIWMSLAEVFNEILNQTYILCLLHFVDSLSCKSLTNSNSLPSWLISMTSFPHNIPSSLVAFEVSCQEPESKLSWSSGSCKAKVNWTLWASSSESCSKVRSRKTMFNHQSSEITKYLYPPLRYSFSMTFASQQHFVTALQEWWMDLLWPPHTGTGRQIFEEDPDARSMLIRNLERQGHWHNAMWHIKFKLKFNSDKWLWSHVIASLLARCHLHQLCYKFLCCSIFFISVPQLTAKDPTSATCMDINTEEWVMSH